jgi:hypothetical protein
LTENRAILGGLRVYQQEIRSNVNLEPLPTPKAKRWVPLTSAYPDFLLRSPRQDRVRHQSNGGASPHLFRPTYAEANVGHPDVYSARTGGVSGHLVVFLGAFGKA